MEHTVTGHGAFVGADGGFIPGGDLLYELAKGPGDGFGGGGGEGVRHHLDFPGEDVQALADGVHVGGGCWFHGGFLLVGGGSAYSGHGGVLVGRERNEGYFADLDPGPDDMFHPVVVLVGGVLDGYESD